MPLAFRRPASGAALVAALLASCLGGASPAAAFKVIDAPGKQGCGLWANDAGQPLRTKAGTVIGRKAPCGDGHTRDVFETLYGEAPGTLVIRDSNREMECILVLAPGSKTVVVPKVCQKWTGG